MTSRRWVKLGLGLVLGLRLIYVFSLPNTIRSSIDERSYDDIARNLISGVGYWDTIAREAYPYADPSAPTARWVPGYPLFVAGVYLVFGESYRSVYIVQAVLGVVIAGFIYLLANRIIGKKAGILAIFLYAIDLFSIYTTGVLLTEQLFTLLVVASLYCFLRMREEGRVRLEFVLLFGFLAGAGALTRNVAGLMFGGLCLAILLGWEEGFKQIRFRDRVFVITVASVMFLGTLAPWIIRNYKLTGQYILSTEVWQTLSMANNDNGGVYLTREGAFTAPRMSIKQPEIEREALYKAFVIDWITTHPAQFALFYLERAIMFWSPFLNWKGAGEVTGVRALLGITFNAILHLSAAITIYTRRKCWRKLLPIYITLLTFTLGYSLAFVATRFRFPLYPLVEILAAGGILFLFERYGKAWERERVSS